MKKLQKYQNLKKKSLTKSKVMKKFGFKKSYKGQKLKIV